MLIDSMQDFIVHLECIDKREVGGKSPCMEKEALKRAVQQLKNLVNLKEVVTDASSSSIIKMMGNLLIILLYSQWSLFIVCLNLIL